MYGRLSRVVSKAALNERYQYDRYSALVRPCTFHLSCASPEVRAHIFGTQQVFVSDTRSTRLIARCWGGLVRLLTAINCAFCLTSHIVSPP